MYRCVRCKKGFQSRNDLVEYLGGQLVCRQCDAELDGEIEGDFRFATRIPAEQPRKQAGHEQSWRLWEERRRTPGAIQEEKFRNLLQRLPIVDESAVLKKWETVDPEEVLDGITDTGDSSYAGSHPASHLVKVHGVASVIRIARGNTSANNGSFSELVDHADLQQVRGITAIVALHRWSQGKTINDLSERLFGVPGWGTNTFLVCRVDEDTYLCYDAEGVANERSTIVTDQKPRVKNNVLAIASLILGIVATLSGCTGPVIGIPPGIAALVTGYIGRRQMKESNDTQTGEGLALAGIILGSVGAFFGLVWTVIMILAILVDRAS